ncbi:enoyl-CoA hydratase/isomerase family protein [Glycomyces sp. TRM65418]|uniref:3-hydroxyacyl-CoA dehydrogenase NAD-binding domain-containing protein n=1 Tax=Glycomyces sp. TRM65418 TaxID=2867006 RepID=UPI001CE568AF|nr:3-hydroxyacyl-CoA dehydrogenase NAD-binding domain-containing protein [Glycomyces sp. TRM65418]MCC3764867.1 enoyl-CoA hydratase/isomerase family protein [Glycomyces sp. TRM65418]QZD54512.1 enoyl-CoA hydratase/isomerase family protein [Glycomyces sp. TRM65418]
MYATPLDLPDFDEEVVTEAHVRYLEPRGLGGRAALITLDNGFDHTKPNSFGPAGLKNLWRALDEVEAAEDVKLVAVTGKPFIFLAGADVKLMPKLESREQGLQLAQAGHAVYKRLKDSAVPTFAFVNGTALGGGFELALHCHYRTVSTSAMGLGLPEVSIGLIPGWGGSQILPNLIGVEKAAQVIVGNPLNQNKMLRGTDLVPMGIADVQFDAADFLEESLEWAVQVATGAITVERPEVDRSVWPMVIAGARELVNEKVHNASAAAVRALDLLELAQHASFEEGSLAEDEALADLEAGPQFQASIYAFNLVRSLAKRPEGAPSPSLAKDIGKVGVVGAGLMAGQIALMFARRLEVPVVMTDLDEERAQRGLAYVRAEIDKLEAKGRASKLKAARLRALVSASSDKSVYADCDLVIEAVFEELKVKQAVFAEVESIVAPECLLVTNTSGLSITAMGSQLAHPERLVGMHFFNPVAVMPLVEVIATEQTDQATLATAYAVAKKLKKTAVGSADRPAFIVNRLLGRMLAEVTGAVDAGTPVEVADVALDDLGLPMRPFALLELVGLQVAWHLCQHLNEDLGPRFPASENLRRMAEAEFPVFDASAKGKGRLTEEAKSLIELGNQPASAEEVKQRVLRGLAEEVQFMLDEGVVPSPKQIDLAMILGAGFPFWLGGLTPYLDRAGISASVSGKPFQTPS